MVGKMVKVSRVEFSSITEKSMLPVFKNSGNELQTFNLHFSHMILFVKSFSEARNFTFLHMKPNAVSRPLVHGLFLSFLKKRPIV